MYENEYISQLTIKKKILFIFFGIILFILSIFIFLSSLSFNFTPALRASCRFPFSLINLLFSEMGLSNHFQSFTLYFIFLPFHVRGFISKEITFHSSTFSKLYIFLESIRYCCPAVQNKTVFGKENNILHI